LDREPFSEGLERRSLSTRVLTVNSLLTENRVENRDESSLVEVDRSTLKTLLSQDTAVIGLRVPLGIKLLWQRFSPQEKYLAKQVFIATVVGLAKQSNVAIVRELSTIMHFPSSKNINLNLNLNVNVASIETDRRRSRVRHLLQKLEKTCSELLPLLDRLHRYGQMNESVYRTIKGKLMALCYDE